MNDESKKKKIEVRMRAVECPCLELLCILDYSISVLVSGITINPRVSGLCVQADGEEDPNARLGH